MKLSQDLGSAKTYLGRQWSKFNRRVEPKEAGITLARRNSSASNRNNSGIQMPAKNPPYMGGNSF